MSLFMFTESHSSPLHQHWYSFGDRLAGLWPIWLQAARAKSNTIESGRQDTAQPAAANQFSSSLLHSPAFTNLSWQVTRLA